MIEVYKKTIGFFGAIFTVLLVGVVFVNVLGWVFDPGSAREQHRKANLHKEESPVWFMNQ